MGVNAQSFDTVQKVNHRLLEIKAAQLDPEKAGILEGELHEGVLMAIAAGHHNPGRLAARALASKLVTFDRWRA